MSSFPEKILAIPTLGLKRDELQEAVKGKQNPDCYDIKLNDAILFPVDNVKTELTNCIYLEDSSCVVMGLNIYGAPWQPEHCGWAFNLPRGQKIRDKWEQVT